MSVELSTIGIIISLALGFLSIAGHFSNWGIGLRGFISPLWSSHEDVPIPHEVVVHGALSDWVVAGNPPIVLMNRAPFHVVVVGYKPGSMDDARKNARNRVWFELKEPQVPIVIRPHEAVRLVLNVHLVDDDVEHLVKDDFENKSYNGSLNLSYKCASFIRKKGELSFKYNFKVKGSVTEC